VAESGIDTKSTRFPKAEVLGEIFSLAVNTDSPIGAVLETNYPFFRELESPISGLLQQYAARKRAGNAMDFDDLLVLWLRLIQQHEQVRDLYQRRFQFVLVDEYQDTNRLQSDLIDLLAARHKNVMVVGDDAQSIYAWRGANFQNILEFPKRYPGATIYKIETNYRSTPEILHVANAAIRSNLQQFSKELAASRKAGPKPILVTCNDAAEQAAFVAQRVLELREEGVDMNDMAVLYRSHFHALELQLELTRRNIPFSITSGTRFFEQAHIKDVTAYLKLVHNPRDELAFKRLVQLLPGAGGKAAEKLWRAFLTTESKPAEEQPLPAGSAPEPAAAGSPRPPARCALRLQACAPAVPKKTAVPWAQFVATVAQLEAPEIRQEAAKMIRLVLDAGYDDYLKENYSNSKSRLEDLEQLSVFARQFSAVEEFLTQLALLTNLDSEQEQPATSDDEQLRLSTVHQAKGLEFGVVFVIMLCDGLFPSARSAETEAGLEEERRLMYVAVTRARNELYLSYPLIRAGHGREGDSLQRPSRFLNEIPIEMVEEWNLRSFA
jgi:DNA helicase-2/ATP-dependent DNA helicase PcrA